MMLLFDLVTRDFNQSKILKKVTRNFHLDLNSRVANSKSSNFYISSFPSAYFKDNLTF